MWASEASAVFAAEDTANTTINAPSSANAFTNFPVLIIIPLFASVASSDHAAHDSCTIAVLTAQAVPTPKKLLKQ